MNTSEGVERASASGYVALQGEALNILSIFSFASPRPGEEDCAALEICLAFFLFSARIRASTLAGIRAAPGANRPRRGSRARVSDKIRRSDVYKELFPEAPSSVGRARSPVASPLLASFYFEILAVRPS